jgi:hypothetical protein
MVADFEYGIGKHVLPPRVRQSRRVKEIQQGVGYRPFKPEAENTARPGNRKILAHLVMCQGRIRSRDAFGSPDTALGWTALQLSGVGGF